jgi:hypothetical protein
MAKVYTSKVLEIMDNGDAVIELPDELCEELGWVVGDTLDIDTDADNNIIIKKIKDA